MNIPSYCLRISFNHFSKNLSHQTQKSCLTSHFTVLLHKRSSSSASSSSITQQKVVQFISSLNDEERKILMDAVKTLEDDTKKIELKGPVTAFRWRSELGRPSKITKISDPDLSGDSANIVGMYNAVPFVGFGFLDNTFMILGNMFPLPPPPNMSIRPQYTHSKCTTSGLSNNGAGRTEIIPSEFDFASKMREIKFIRKLKRFSLILGLSIDIMAKSHLQGDTIELMLGSMITISTMAAAALGNTMADILGIGSAYYVEKIATRLGFQQPQEVTPAQLTLNCSRVAANLGRTIGVTVGCILGMFPLLFK
ncbi:hypothetical protein ACFE04_021522 [Oxalis oulophora]